MRKFTKLILVFVFSLTAAAMHAQSTDSTQAPDKPTPAVAEPAPSAPASVNGQADTTQPVSAPAVVSGQTDTTQPVPPSSTMQPDTNNQVLKTPPAASDTPVTKQKRDIQNQVQFMKPDMESKNYNFYQRKEISQPLMPRYDLDSAVYQKGRKKEKQQEKFLARQYAFPARPKDQWELGLNVGAAYLSGNVKPYTTGPGVFENVGGGFTVRKAIGYFFSIRGGYNFMMMTGRDYQPNENLEFNQALNGTYNPVVNYYTNPNLLPSRTVDHLNMNHLFFYNYRAWVHEAHLEGVFNIGNINFHKERNFVNFYLLGGISGFFFTTYMDALDKNGHVYDFSKVEELYFVSNNHVNSREQLQRKQALELLNQIYNNGYTVPAEHDNDKPGIKNWEFDPSATAGMGVQFHISRWVTLGLEERVIFTQAHVDGYFWQQDEHPALVSHYDNISYTSINVNIHLGKNRTEPLYWLNPVYHTYRKLGEVDPQALMEQMFKDDDDDGVPNYLDREPNTPKGCPVDAHGVALDSDHDGIIDCLDKEPYSPPGYPVDSNGVAIIPPNPCCDSVGRANREALNNGNNGQNGINGQNGVNGQNGQNGINGQNGENVENGGLGGAGKRKGNAGYDCSKIELPAVMFDQDKYYLDPQYYGNLHQVAERMQMCPDMKLVVTGYDESRNDQKYNEQLGWNRANAAVDYLVEKYGISRDRFIIKYQGGKKAAEGTPFEKKLKNKVEFRYSNEGENGDSNPPAPHPGLKAGSNK